MCCSGMIYIQIAQNNAYAQFWISSWNLHEKKNIHGALLGPHGLFWDDFYSGSPEQHIGTMRGPYVLFWNNIYSDCSEQRTWDPCRAHILFFWEGFYLNLAQKNIYGAHIGPSCVVLEWFLFRLPRTTHNYRAHEGPIIIIMCCSGIIYLNCPEQCIWDPCGAHIHLLFWEDFYLKVVQKKHMGPTLGPNVLLWDDFYSECLERYI